VATHYHIYGNLGGGGPIDYSTVVATVATLSWSTPALAASSRWKYGLRSFDTVSGLEEKNVDAVVEIVLSGSQADVTNLPASPQHLTVTPTSGGGCRVEWSYPAITSSRPTGFHVYVGTPTPNYASVAATVAYTFGRLTYRATLSGLSNGVVYQVGVRSYNATGEEANVATVEVTGKATPPSNVDSLTAVAVSTAD
jgi:hypothetical protein